MKKILASLAAVVLVSSSAMAATGWLDSYARIWDGSADANYDLNADFGGTPGTINAEATVGDFNGANLGTFALGYTMFLNAEISAWADAGDAFSNFSLIYRVNGGGWVTDAVNSIDNLGGNDWRGEATGNDLSGLGVGIHTIELYLSRTHTWGGGSYTAYANVGSDSVEGIGGAVDPDSTPPADGFFTATFEVVPEPGTLALFGLGIAGLMVARRRKA